MYSVENYETKSIGNRYQPDPPDQGGLLMPVISVERGPSTAEVKSELIKKLTKTAAEITKIPESAFVILIKEYPVDAIGVGGIPLSERV